MPVVTALCSTRNEQLAPPSFRRLTAVDSQPAPLVSADEAQTLYLWARFEEGSDLDVVTDVSAGCDLPVSDDGTTAVPLVDGCVLRYGTEIQLLDPLQTRSKFVAQIHYPQGIQTF